MAHSHGEGFQWVGLTVLGLVAGLALALPLGVPIFAVLGAMVGTPVVLSIVGFSLGTAQWPIIRRHVASSGWWIVMSALGMAVGLTAGVTLVEQIGRAVMGGQVNFRMLGVAARAASFGTIGLMAGTSLGLAQWLLLRRHAASCKSWISVNALSLAAGLASGALQARWAKSSLQVESFPRPSDSCCTKVTLNPHTQNRRMRHPFCHEPVGHP